MTTSSSTTTTTANTQQPTDPSVPSDAIYVSANGSKNGNGTQSNPYDFATAVTKVQPGGTIAVAAGTYKFSSTIKIDKSNSGSAGKYKTVTTYNGDVTFDFSGQSTGSSNRGINMCGNY